ncbi:MAG: toll/interleukin-1 receptor domain-containing protein [Malacoplasma sp.]|nr:toll/interleukin-1 receptor domain-containing protein [Malacoplasma sp.]
MGKIFISHSTKDNIVPFFVNFLTSIGIKNGDIFCSSMEGHGVKNGERINESIKKELNEVAIIIYLITNNFIKSTYCIQELGASLVLNGSTRVFLFKFDDINDFEIKGFIDSSYKYNLFNTDGLSSLYDELDDIFNLKNKQAVINRAINDLVVKTKDEIKSLVEDKDKTDEVLKKEKIKNLEKQYEDLSIGEKRIIGSIYFCDDAVGYYSISNGTIGLLLSKLFVMRTTSLSTGFQQFAYALQPWVINMIKRNPNIENELKSIVEKEKNINDSPYGDFW